MILYALLILVVVGCVIAVETHGLLSSVISVGVAGFGLSIVYLLLGAPDIAIPQVVVEVLCLVILIRIVETRHDTVRDKPSRVFPAAAVLVFAGLFLAFSYAAFSHFPKLGEPLARVSDQYVREGLSTTGSANLVTSVLLDFRGYDTLGEATVLFVSIIGVVTVLRRKGRIRQREE